MTGLRREDTKPHVGVHEASTQPRLLRVSIEAEENSSRLFYSANYIYFTLVIMFLFLVSIILSLRSKVFNAHLIGFVNIFCLLHIVIIIYDVGVTQSYYIITIQSDFFSYHNLMLEFFLFVYIGQSFFSRQYLCYANNFKTHFELKRDFF